MKTKSKINNHAAEAKSTGNNPQSRVFNVTLFRSQESYCNYPVPASSEEEALRNAVMWAPFLNLDWKADSWQIRPVQAREITKDANN